MSRRRLSSSALVANAELAKFQSYKKYVSNVTPLSYSCGNCMGNLIGTGHLCCRGCKKLFCSACMTIDFQKCIGCKSTKGLIRIMMNMGNANSPNPRYTQLAREVEELRQKVVESKRLKETETQEYLKSMAKRDEKIKVATQMAKMMAAQAADARKRAAELKTKVRVAKMAERYFRPRIRTLETEIAEKEGAVAGLVAHQRLAKPWITRILLSMDDQGIKKQARALLNMNLPFEASMVMDDDEDEGMATQVLPFKAKTSPIATVRRPKRL